MGAGRFRIARQLVQADGDRLAKVHREMLFAGGDVHKPVAVGEIVVRKYLLQQAMTAKLDREPGVLLDLLRAREH